MWIIWLRKNVIWRDYMKKVFIKYNPYKLETEITVDGKELAYNSKIAEKISPGSRLQEWVEELPSLLIDEYNDIDFDITFHGTIPDFEDLTEVLNLAYENDKLKATLNRKPAKEISDKEELIDNVFKKIQDGPFNELKSNDILNAFKNVKNDNFDVYVVAATSAGKSTLINALIGTKIMDSNQKVPISISTKIQNDNNENISVDLIDTPRLNNYKNVDYNTVQRKFLSDSSNTMVLYIMEGNLAYDANSLLQSVFDSMNVGGKQFKDRFIFLVNKMDNCRKEDNDTEKILERIRVYLKKHGINKPNLFPVAALLALNIRLISKGEDVDEDTLDEIDMKVRKLNRTESLHLESYALLPTSIRNDINRQLLEAKSERNIYKEALIHTGIVSVEAAISRCVEKYAKKDKIKNLVDTLLYKIDEAGCFEKTKQEFVANVDVSKRIVEHIYNIRNKIADVKSAKKFKENVNSTVKDINDKSKKVIDSINEKYQTLIKEHIDDARGKFLYEYEIESELKKLEAFSKKIETDFYIELNELIREKFIKTYNVLLNEYRTKLSLLTDQIYIEGISTIKIDSLGLMKSIFIPITDFSLEKLIYERGSIDCSELYYNFLSYVQRLLYYNKDGAYSYIKNQSNKITESFDEEFKRLNSVIKEKLVEINSCIIEKKKVEKNIIELQDKLKWLKNIKIYIESILEI